MTRDEILIEGLKKIAWRYDGAQGGRIWEDEMRNIAIKTLESVGVQVFVKMDESEIKVSRTEREH